MSSIQNQFSFHWLQQYKNANPGHGLMNKSVMFIGTLVAFLGLTCHDARAQLPEDFPELVVINTADAAPGVFIGSIGPRNSSYNVVLDRSGYPLFYSKTERLTKFIQPNGLIAVANGQAKGFDFKDETFAQVDSFVMQGDEYNLDNHDVSLLPNGHCLLIGQEHRYIDMSQLTPGGQPDALVTGDIVQEFNANKELIFEWHTFDHMAITNSFWGITKKTIDYAHINHVRLDPKDNNIICSFRQTTDIVKINRSTGEIIWRLGGQVNDFTFIGEHEENAPYYFVGQHSAIPDINGNLILFDNGGMGRGTPTSSDRDYTRVVEYHLDETNRTATMVWEYRHDPDIFANAQGNVRRLPNGNTYIYWGAGVGPSGVACTEVSPAGEVVNEISFPQAGPNAELMKQEWNSPDLVTSETFANVVAGQTYHAINTGVSVTVNNLADNAYPNGLVVKKHREATRFARFAGKSPQLLVKRVTLAGYGMTALNLDATFGTQDLEINDPSQLTVYHRPSVGQGEFTALPTTYDAVSETLQVADVSLGEFVFGYPDAPELAIAPRLYTPEDAGTVNQEQPVKLWWNPNGLFRSCHLQVATDAAFNHLIVDEAGLKELSYLLASVDPGTQYFWRVNTSNNGGTSDWTTRSFTTVAPKIQVTVPNGGEGWQRGLDYYIRWEDNLAEDVIIDLYQGGTFVMSIATNASMGAYEWEADLTLAPGSDYSIAIRSATNAAVSDLSDLPFSIIDAPTLDAGSISRLPEGQVQISMTVPGVDQVTVLGSTNLVDWEVLQVVPLTNGSALFTDDTATNFSSRFYQIRMP